MAFPFGSTSLGAYLRWAESAGCDCKNGYIGLATFWLIKAPGGKSVVIADVDQAERLTSSYINYLDRRLGLTSPFDRGPPAPDE